MLKEYLAELQKTPLLSREEETELWQRYAGGDQEAYNKLMTSYQPLVFKTAAGFKLPEQQTMELVQEGMLGLLEAAERYDYKLGIAFSVFAVHRIRGRMLDFLHVEDGAKSFSLDDTNAAGVAWADVLAASGRTPFEEAELNMITDRVAQALQRLPAKEQQVLTGIYLEDRSAADMADSIHVSLGHIYRLQKQGVKRIRGMLSHFMADLKEANRRKQVFLCFF